MAHWRKSAVLAIFLHTKQQKIFQGTLGTQDLTPIWSAGVVINTSTFWGGRGAGLDGGGGPHWALEHREVIFESQIKEI